MLKKWTKNSKIVDDFEVFVMGADTQIKSISALAANKSNLSPFFTGRFFMVSAALFGSAVEYITENDYLDDLLEPQFSPGVNIFKMLNE